MWSKPTAKDLEKLAKILKEKNQEAQMKQSYWHISFCQVVIGT